jgi:cytoskeletal protein CcmA (bactofilin family)
MALKDLVSKGVRAETGAASAQSPRAATPPPPAPAPRSAPVALLDASVEFTGTITCQESIRIDGRCKGELYSDHSVIIGEPAVLEMLIEADAVVVAGQVHGDITARRKITLERTARVKGNLCTPGIVIQEGAQLEGRIVIGSEAETAQPVPAGPARRAEAESPAEQAEARPPAKERPVVADSAIPRPRKPNPSAPPPTS